MEIFLFLMIYSTDSEFFLIQLWLQVYSQWLQSDFTIVAEFESKTARVNLTLFTSKQSLSVHLIWSHFLYSKTYLGLFINHQVKVRLTFQVFFVTSVKEEQLVSNIPKFVIIAWRTISLKLLQNRYEYITFLLIPVFGMNELSLCCYIQLRYSK